MCKPQLEIAGNRSNEVESFRTFESTNSEYSNVVGRLEKASEMGEVAAGRRGEEGKDSSRTTESGVKVKVDEKA